MKNILFILFLFAAFLGKAQENENTEIPDSFVEKVVLHTDRDLYLTEEKIWFKANCTFSEKLETNNLSNILYVELYNHSREFIVKRKFTISNGTVYGSLEIPSEFLSGNYFLRSYTQFLKNYPPENYFTSIITIINPKLALTQEIEPSSTEDLNFNSEYSQLASDEVIQLKSEIPSNNRLIVKSQKESYSPRELIKLDIESINQPNNILIDLSVSIVKKGTYRNSNTIPKYIFGNLQLMNSYLREHPNLNLFSDEQLNNLMGSYNKLLSKNSGVNISQKSKNKIQWIPEIRDVSISGFVIHKETKKPIADIPIYISAFKENPQIHVYKTKKDGSFVFSLNNLVNHQDLFLCANSKLHEDLEIQINNDFSNKYPQINKIPLEIDSSYKSLLEQMYVNLQAGKVFKTETGTKQLPVYNFPFNLGEPQISIRLEDYVNTSDVETVFRELIPRIIVKKKQGQFSLSVHDFEKKTFYNEPLIILDNILIFDVNEIMKISSANIEEISVYNEPLILGDNTISGIISIKTKTDNFGGIKTAKGSIFFKYQTISPSFEFNPPEYDTNEKRLNRVADFRNLLYWNPSLTLNKETSVSFYASDHCSEYEVIVKGHTKSGQIYFGKTSFSVK